MRTYAYHEGDNVILGARAIATYIKSRGMGAFMRLVNDYEFPVMYRLSDGRMFTTMKAIDQWLLIASAATHQPAAVNAAIRRLDVEDRMAERRRLKKEAVLTASGAGGKGPQETSLDLPWVIAARGGI